MKYTSVERFEATTRNEEPHHSRKNFSCRSLKSPDRGSLCFICFINSANLSTVSPFFSLLFFAVYEIYKKNYSFSRVVFLFFYPTKTANSFCSKINDSGSVGQQGSQAVGSGLESLPCPKFLRFIPNIFRHPKIVKY